jgi:predicted small lipoprotein YifL
MIKLSRHLVRGALLCALLAAGITACGQRGPLELPEKLRPVQRVEPAAATTPEKQDDERKDER